MLKEKISQDLKNALKNQEQRKISILRILLSEIHNEEIEKKGDLADSQILKILSTEKKKHQDSISQFQQGGREDLVSQEQAELEVIESYLPEPLSDNDLRQLVKEVIGNRQATGPQNFGEVMKEVMQQSGGRAEGSRVSQIVKEELKSLALQ